MTKNEQAVTCNNFRYQCGN